MDSNFWAKAQALDRRIIYMVLILVVVASLFVKYEVPAKADDSSVAFYNAVDKLNRDKPILLQSDWTNSTRGENAGHLEAILKILSSRKQKFVLYSLADPQAPQVARNVLAALNMTLPEDQKLRKGIDYLDLGFFPNAEGTTQAMSINLRNVWGSRRTVMPDGSQVGIFDTPVLQKVSKIEDCAAVIYVTASNTIDIGIQRLSGKLPLLCMCTGVVGPSLLPYWQSAQLEGIAIGLKGVYDVEMMMAYGINVMNEAKGKVPVVSTTVSEQVPGIPGYVHEGRGKRYFFALNIALGLMVFAVVFGNIAMALAKKQGGGK